MLFRAISLHEFVSENGVSPPSYGQPLVGKMIELTSKLCVFPIIFRQTHMFLMLLMIVDAKITTEDSESISRLNCKKRARSLSPWADSPWGNPKTWWSIRVYQFIYFFPVNMAIFPIVTRTHIYIVGSTCFKLLLVLRYTPLEISSFARKKKTVEFKYHTYHAVGFNLFFKFRCSTNCIFSRLEIILV